MRQHSQRRSALHLGVARLYLFQLSREQGLGSFGLRGSGIAECSRIYLVQLVQAHANQKEHSSVAKLQQGKVSARRGLGEHRFLAGRDGFIDHPLLQEIETVGLGIGRLLHRREQGGVKFGMFAFNYSGKFLVIHFAARRVDE